MTGIFRHHVAGDPAAAWIRAPDAADARWCIADALDQSRDPAPALVHADGENLDAVAVHQRRGIGARQHQGRRTVVRHHQHLAAGAPAHPARHPFSLAGRREAVRPLDRLAVAHHGGESFRQGVALRAAVQAEAFGEACRGQGLRRLRQMLQ